MKFESHFRRAAVGLALVSFSFLLACGGEKRPEPLTVFFAASLEGPIQRWSQMFREGEGIEVRHERSGSQVAARKVSELGRAGDLVLVADYHVINWLLMPEHARWQAIFAGNEIVIAHSEQSRYAAELTADNWREVLLRDDVRVGRADENQAPIGYQTLLVWELSDIEAGVPTTDTAHSVAARLRERIPPSLVRPDVKSLAGLLGVQVDYVFLFRSIAHEHNLKYLRLPATINLADPDHAADYARATVVIQKSTRNGVPGTTQREKAIRSQPRAAVLQNEDMIEVRGGPIQYGLTIPKSAPHPEAAARFVQLILSDDGQRVLEGMGFGRVEPARAIGRDEMPESLQPLVKEWNEDSAD